MIFVNLPVRDLDRSLAFFDKVGYQPNPQFSDETAACLVVSETIFVMVLTEAKFKEFTKKQLADTNSTTEVILALSAESRAEVDQVVDRAIAAGAGPANDPMDLGFMYSRSFHDLDGHMWEYVWMDPNAEPPHEA